MLWIIASVVIGTVFYTIWGYGWKKFKDPTVAFDMSFLYSMLIAMLLTIITVPFVLNNQMIPDKLLIFVLFGCGSLGFAANALFNTPLAYYVHQVQKLKALVPVPAVPAASISTTTRRIIEAIALIGLISAVIGASVYATISYSATITASGSITGVGVTFYADNAGNVKITSINWGNIAPGDSVTVTVWVKSTSNVPITLTKQVMDWNPAELASELTFSWNYAGTVINPGAIIPIDFTLTASSSAPPGTSFTFNIIVTATG